MVSTDNSVLNIEVNKIVSNTKSDSYSMKYDVILHTSSIDYSVKIIESVEIVSDFNSSLSDYVLLSCMIPAGDYVYDIHSERDNLEVTLKRTITGKSHIQRYKLMLVNNKNSIDGTRYTSSTRDELNAMEMIRIEGQCVNRTFEKLRLVLMDGVFRFIKLEELIRSKYDQALKIINGKDNYRIDIVPVINDNVYDHIEVPTGTELVELPTYLQETHYGLYNGNIGTYLKYQLIKREYNPDNSIKEEIWKDTLFVYPLYNTTRFDKVKKKLIIYSVPDLKYDNVEHTYLEDGDIIKIIAGHSAVGLDTGTDELVDKGNAITVTNADNVMMRNSDVSDNDVTVSTDLLNSGEDSGVLKDNTTNAKHIGPEGNIYKHRSVIVKSKMMPFQLQWNYCDPDLIYPSMPCMLIYSKDGKLVKLKGTVQSLYTLADMSVNTMNGLLNIMVEKNSLKE